MAGARPGSLSKAAQSIARGAAGVLYGAGRCGDVKPLAREAGSASWRVSVRGNEHQVHTSIVRRRDHPHDSRGRGAGVGAAVRQRALEGEAVAGLEPESALADPEIEGALDHQSGL